MKKRTKKLLKLWGKMIKEHKISSDYSRAFIELTTETVIEGETRRMKFCAPV